MPGRIVDLEGLKSPAVEELRRMAPPGGLPFSLAKLGHVVIKVSDMKRSVAFYTGVIGLRVSDVYPETMMKGGMVFLRCNTDHHCLALIGGLEGDPKARGMHHFAFEVATLGEVLRARAHLRAANVQIDFEGRRRAGCQIAIEFRDPDNHHLEIYCFLDQVGSDGRVRPPEEWREETSLEDAIAQPAPGQDTTLHER
jgi:catechol 2,3-dioxygenase-like lactoylglutathione lyase family enzyme